MPLNRRQFAVLTAASASTLRPAWAHHGWSSFDQDRPLYLEGTVATTKWQNPHAELLIDVAPGLKLPTGLATRAVPAQSATVDGPGLLAKAAVPRQAHPRWELELAPLTRLSAWGLMEIPPGTPVSAVGYLPPGEQGEPVMRVEFLFVGGKAYGLRSSPA